MIFPEKMVKVQIITHKKWKREIIESLYNLGVLHIKDYIPGEFELGKPLEEAEEISRILLKIRAALSKLPKVSSKKEKEIKSRKDVEKLCEDIISTVEKINFEQREVENKIKKLEKFLEIKRYLKAIGADINLFWESKKIAIISGLVKTFDEKAFKEIEILALKYSKIDNFYVIFIVSKKENEEKIRKILQNFNFNEFDYSLIKEMKNINPELELEKLKKKSKELQERLKSLAEQNLKTLEIWKERLEEQAEKAEAPLKFAESKNVILIEGWVPAKEVNKIINAVKEITKDKVYIKTEEVKRREEAPVKLSHPYPISSFKTFLEIYSLPKYGEIDPTFFLFLTFPIYFGFMLGDIGYGIVTLVLALVIKKKIPSLKEISNVFILASFSTIFFGFLYGEFFGVEEILGIKLPHVISRIHGIYELFTVSIIFGLVHITIGLILGFINAYIAHGIKHAIIEKGSWLLIEFAGILFFLLWKNSLNINPLIPEIMFIVGVILLLKGEGFLGIAELPTLLSHILSYSRLMGMGIAIASLGLIINDIAGKILAQGFIFIPIAIIILILGHALHVAIALLECSLHALRLNWVEFFTKFYKGGGIPYTPFGKK